MTRSVKAQLEIYQLGKYLLCPLILAFAFTTPAMAGGDPYDEYRTVATFDLQGRNQPLGSALKMRFFNEYEFMQGNVSPFFDPVWLRGGAILNLSPAYADVGLDFEISPIRLFKLRVAYEATGYFGSLYYIYSFDEPTPQLDDDGVDELRGSEEPGIAHRLSVEPTFQLAFGNIAVRNTFSYIRSWHPSDQFERQYVREPLYDRMLKVDGDSILVNSLLLLYKVWDPDGDDAAQMLLGPFHEWSKGVHLDDVRHRVGLTFVAVPKNNFGKLQTPRLLLQAGYNIVDRENNREGHIFVQGGIGFDLVLRE